MKFREHRGALEDSMATLVELPDRKALLAHCRKLLAPYQFHFSDPALKVYRYRFDARINWDTHIVIIKGYGVMGFTDAPVEEPS